MDQRYIVSHPVSSYLNHRHARGKYNWHLGEKLNYQPFMVGSKLVSRRGSTLTTVVTFVVTAIANDVVPTQSTCHTSNDLNSLVNRVINEG